VSKEHAYAYEAGYRDGSINYELEHCPACKNVADLQEALAENAKLRELCAEILHIAESNDPDFLHWPEIHDELRKLGVKIVKI
jgi:hypothetical protein